MSKTEFEFSDNVMYLKGVGPRKAAVLENKLNIVTMYDFLTHYPRDYEDQSKITPIADLEVEQSAVLHGRISNISKRETGRLTIINAILSDRTGHIPLTWFNQDWIYGKLRDGMTLVVVGKVKLDSYSGMPTMNQITSFSILDYGERPILGIVPTYPATASLNQNFFRAAMQNLLNKMPPLKEILPKQLIAELNLISLDEATRAIHFPKSYEQLAQARRRLAFDELFMIQCGLLLIKKQTQDDRLGVEHKKNSKLVKEARERLIADLESKLTADQKKEMKVGLTADQKKTFREVAKDMESKLPMRRLVQGDVGSGKTAVAMLALVKTVENGFQGAFMAPTEILAVQHFEYFTKLLEPLGIRIGLLSAKVTKSKKMREEIYRKIAEHELDIVIGTHALIQEDVKFARLGLVVTDEQHRFGIKQRATLEKKSELVPDMLVMTATPIPRTMTLTVYGDLEVSQIKQLPPGRTPVKTYVRTKRARKAVYEFVENEILRGRQAYVVCPLIERSESEKMQHIDPATEIYEMLRTGILRDYSIGLLHGKMKPAEKDSIMESFRAGEIDVLVSTTVIEVGVDVPNATVMVVEQAERFGLAQLHQLRGRVGRDKFESYCILISNSQKDVAQARLDIMERSNDGFKLAEEDLKLRGPGQFFGEAQHGLPDLKVADVFRDIELLITARDAAEKFITTEADLNYFAQLRKNLALAYGDKFSQITAN